MSSSFLWGYSLTLSTVLDRLYWACPTSTITFLLGGHNPRIRHGSLVIEVFAL